MLERLFFVFLGLIILFLGYEAYTLYQLRSAPFEAPAEKTIGPEDANLVVVEFIDYSCPVCRSAQPVIDEAVQQDGKVRLIPRPVKSANEDATTAAYLVHAAALQGKFVETHSYLIQDTLPSLASEEEVKALAQRLGMDDEKLFEDLKSDAVYDLANRNHQMAVALGVRRVPTLLVGPDIQYEPPEDATVQDYLKVFEEARALQK